MSVPITPQRRLPRLPRRAVAAAAAVITILGLLQTGLVSPAADADPPPCPTLPAPTAAGVEHVSGLTLEPGPYTWVPEPGNPGQYVKQYRTDRSWPGRLCYAVLRSPSDIYDSPAPDEKDPNLHVRIYIPDHVNLAQADIPVLYLLHGSLDERDGDDAAGWQNRAMGPEMIEASQFPGIVVMPEGGRAGWYTDWNKTDNGDRKPKWESFHMGKLIPWVEANFPTVSKQRSGRYIAGVSMGSFGALRYASRYPHLFSAVGAFSGPTRLSDPITRWVIWGEAFLAGTSLRFDQETDSTWDVPLFLANDYVYSEDPAVADLHDPAKLVEGLKASGMKVGLYTGNGNPRENVDYGEDEDGSVPPSSGGWLAGLGELIEIDASEVEQLTLAATDEYYQSFATGPVKPRYCKGDGLHHWADWNEVLEDFLRYLHTDPGDCPNDWALQPAPTGKQ